MVSYYATREVHLAHSGVPFRNYSRWTQADCSHVCSPSGPDELRTSLLYYTLVSNPNPNPNPNPNSNQP